jgi:hypothetical protein
MMMIIILTRGWVIVGGVWIDGRICWTLWYSPKLHFTVRCYKHTHASVQIHVFNNRSLVSAPNG